MTTEEVKPQIMKESDTAPGMTPSDLQKKDQSRPETSAFLRNVVELSAAMKTFTNKVFVVDFFASWCGPCRLIAPKLKELQERYSNVVLLKVDVDEAEDIAEKYGVSAIPTFVAFKGGNVIETLIGSDEEKIEDLFKKYN